MKSKIAQLHLYIKNRKKSLGNIMFRLTIYSQTYVDRLEVKTLISVQILTPNTSATQSTDINLLPIKQFLFLGHVSG